MSIFYFEIKVIIIEYKNTITSKFQGENLIKFYKEQGGLIMANYKFTIFSIKHCDAVPSIKDKAFYTLMQIKENVPDLRISKLGNFAQLKESDFERFNYSHKVGKYTVYTVKNINNDAKRKYFIPSELIEETEGWSRFTKKASSFANMVNQYKQELALL